MATNAAMISDMPIPPGEYLEELLESLGMSKDELAQRMGRPPSKLSAIFNGSKAVTPETALQLERVTGVGAHIWSTLEAEYRLVCARKQQNEAADLRQDQRHVDDYSYSMLRDLGLVKEVRTAAEKAEELRRYFGVSALSNLEHLRRYEPVFRLRRGWGAAEARALAAWLRIGEIRGQDANCRPFEAAALRAKLGEVRALSQGDPENYLPALDAALANLGVAFVWAPHRPELELTGAVFRLGPQKAVLMLPDLDFLTDGFWLCVFHGLAHLVLHPKAGTIIEWDMPARDEACREVEAGQFALDALVDSRKYEAFARQREFDRAAIERFASQLAVHPSLVLCRLQLDKLVPRRSALNKLRHKVSPKLVV